LLHKFWLRADAHFLLRWIGKQRKRKTTKRI
jgi:hypothetical protein